MNNSHINVSNRSQVLAERIIEGANSLAEFASKLSEAEWKMPVEGDGRTVGVVVHHVASVYPIEIELAQVLASGQSITDATKEAIDQMNDEHAKEFENVGKAQTLELLRINSNSAANSVKTFIDADLDNSASVSLNANAPLTAQFFIEDHALRHSFHHLLKIRSTLKKS